MKSCYELKSMETTRSVYITGNMNSADCQILPQTNTFACDFVLFQAERHMFGHLDCVQAIIG